MSTSIDFYQVNPNYPFYIALVDPKLSNKVRKAFENMGKGLKPPVKPIKDVTVLWVLQRPGHPRIHITMWNNGKIRCDNFNPVKLTI